MTFWELSKIEKKLIGIVKQQAPQIISFFFMLFVFMYGYDKYGINRTLIVLLILIILSLRRIGADIGKAI